jgi:hypothetical protein
MTEYVEHDFDDENAKTKPPEHKKVRYYDS